MSKLSEAKILGGIGAILMLFGGFILPGLGAIIGLVLVFIAVKYIASETKDESIFDNYLMYFICSIIAIVAVVVIFFYSIGFSLTFFTALESMEFTDFSSVWDFFSQYLLAWIIAAVVGWIFIIISALYLRKCYDSIAKRTNVHLFKTTGLVYLIGVVTLIIGIGIVIMLIAKIIEIVAYFSLPEKLPGKK